MTDRLYIASEISRRLGLIQSDILELKRLLKGETLSEDFHAQFTRAATDLFEIAHKARPRVPVSEAAE